MLDRYEKSAAKDRGNSVKPVFWGVFLGGVGGAGGV